MPKPFKLAILRARHNSAYQTIPDQTCIEMIMTGRQSVLRYWADTTQGFFDFVDSALMPWVDVVLAPPSTDRGTQVTVAIQALRDANPGFDPLVGFDGVLLLTHPGGAIVNGAFMAWDGGSGELGDGRPFSAITTVPSTSVFICHELGHTLGFDHAFGIDNNGTDWAPGDATIIVGPEYGAPHDIMSAMAFGTRWLGAGPFWSGNPTFLGDDVPNWPSQTGRWRGPHLSRANLHRWYPEAFAPGRVIDRSFPAPGETGRVRLHPPSARSGPTLLILHPPVEPASGVGRVYVEYRPAQDWDIGLKMSGTDLAQAGLVVHTLETVAPGVERVWYRGGVPMNGVDMDFQLPTGQLTITLEEYANGDGGWADVVYGLGSTRTVSIRMREPIETPIGQSGSTAGRTPCGDEITKVVWSSSTLTFFAVSTLGFGGSAISATPPTIAWRVDGKTLFGQSGTVDVSFDGSVFTLEYTIDPVTFELGLTSRGGEKVGASIEATASEAGGGASATAQARFEARGWFEAYTPESVAAMARCIEKLANVDVLVDVPIGPPGPGPVERIDPAEVRGFAERVFRDAVVLNPRTQIGLARIGRFGERNR